MAELKARMTPLESQLRSYALLNSVIDTSHSTPVYLLRRGNPETPGPEVEPGFLAALTDPDKATTIPEPPAGVKTSGRRLALARWLTDRGSPSGARVARVITNRIWQHLFGEGIVSAPENFGRSGMGPSHAELLEWLAVEFGRRDWRIKPMIKLVVMSTAYRQASHQRPLPSSARAVVRQSENAGADPFGVDPGNRLLWRMRLRRLESEIVRDSILTVSGRLEHTIGGPSIPVEAQPNGMVVISKKDATESANPNRRSLYLMARRNYNLSLLSVFDQPSMNTNCPKRTASAVVLQSLFMLNDSFVLEQSRYFAERISKMARRDPETEITLAFQLALGRKPSAKETAWSRDFLTGEASRLASSSASDEQPLASLCHVLLNTNEFLYIP